MTRLANPAAVARFADNNVAHFPNGGGGGGDLCLANVKFVNDTDSELAAGGFINGGTFYDEQNHAINNRITIEFTVAANSERSQKLVAYVDRQLGPCFCFLSNTNPVISELVNAKVINADNDTAVLPLDPAQPSSFTLTVSGNIS